MLLRMYSGSSIQVKRTLESIVKGVTWCHVWSSSKENPLLTSFTISFTRKYQKCIFCWSFWRFCQSVSLVWLELGELPGGTSCDSTSLAPPWRHCWWMLVTGHITSRIIWLTSYQNASKIEHYQSALMVIISLSMLSMLPSECEASSTVILPKALRHQHL